MKTRKATPRESGFVLLIVYAILIVISLLSIAFFIRHQIAVQSTERYQNRILAFNAAESGIDFALRRLATDATIRTGTATTPYTSANIPLEQNAFQFVISPVAGKPMFRKIDAQGCAPSCDNTARAYQASKVTVFCQITAPAPPASLFEYGIYATHSISLSGSNTSAFDSYNSNQGAYGGSNISNTGAIAANTTAMGAIFLKNTTVNGSVLVGDDGNPNSVITLQKATITGEKTRLNDEWELAQIPPLPEVRTEINLSNVSSNSVITLAPGTYHTTSIKISGNGQVVTTGAVKIYVDGAIDIAGNGITVPENHPGNLHLYETGSADIKIAGNGSFYGGIFAPQSNVSANGNGDVFGAVVAKNFSTVGNSAVHFDLAMKEHQPVDPNQTQIVRITTWQEINSLAWNTGTAQ